MPNFFFGALLVWFGVEISRDWLVLSYYKLTRIEYGLLWLTFGFVMQVRCWRFVVGCAEAPWILLQGCSLEVCSIKWLMTTVVYVLH